MSKHRTITDLIIKKTNGLLSTITDIVLGELFLMWEMETGHARTIGQAALAIEKAHQDLEGFNSQRIKRAIRYLKERGLIEFVEEELFLKPVVTKKGLERISTTFPRYEKVRPWDGSIYFIFYDVPEKERRKRELLYQLLKQLKTAPVQFSVWAALYNPTEILEKFQQEQALSGSLIVSCLGKRGYISGESRQDFVARVFKLNKLNERYEDFVLKYRNAEGVDKLELMVDFYSILGDDPQLPFEILPDDWLGNEAFELFSELTKKPSFKDSSG